MNRKSAHHVTLSDPTFQALNLVADADRISPNWMAERVIAAYLEARLEGIHETYHHQKKERPAGQVIDLAARRASRHHK